MIDEDEHLHHWEPSETDGLARCTADGCPHPQRPYSAAERELIDHWDTCPAPPDAGCPACYEAYQVVRNHDGDTLGKFIERLRGRGVAMQAAR